MFMVVCSSFSQLSSWITEKLQIALDDSYRDPTNLQAKLQKHQAFEAELMANRNRVDAVISEGQGLRDDDHYQSEDIKKRMEEVETNWEALLAASSEKKDKLTDAYQALQFNRIVDDLLTWMDEVENQLMSEDHGKDLTSVKNLLKKHQVKLNLFSFFLLILQQAWSFSKSLLSSSIAQGMLKTG